MLSQLIECGKCGWRTTCGEDELARRLRTLGLLRRAPHPPTELLSELLRVNIHRLACDACHNTGLYSPPISAGAMAGSENFVESDDDGNWQQARICEICREPTSPDRLEVFPTARRCAKCQDIADRGVEPASIEYCPKCGAVLEMRVSGGGGITRYKQFCTGDPPCRL
jgi:hypothetical protein